jgi:glutamate racemase
VKRYSTRAVAFLLSRGVKAVVVACNTASSLALEEMTALSPVPVIGVVEPGARAAVRAAAGTESPIAVLATEATVASDAYGRAIRALDPGREVLHVACPLFVPLAEEGWTDNEVADAAAKRYLGPVAASGARVVARLHTIAPRGHHRAGPAAERSRGFRSGGRGDARRAAA